MNLLQALRYFVKEALASALGSWQANLLAVLTCALSLFVGAFFFLVSTNLSRETDSWQGGLRVSVFLKDSVAPEEIERLRDLVRAPPWIDEAEFVSTAATDQRFREAFPQIADALGEANSIDLPRSIEGTLRQGSVDQAAWDSWVGELRSEPSVSSVDDDRDWVREVQRFSVWIRTAGLTLSLGLLIAAAFTIAAVVRLSAYQYLEEISVLRLVGATEFFVRGPFVMEGLLQGLTGGVLAIAGARFARAAAISQTQDSLWMQALFGEFLSLPSQATLVLLGGAAGLFGAVLSIRRESLEVLDDQPG